MADDKNINLMPEDLRGKEERAKAKSILPFSPDLSAPGRAKPTKISSLSGSTPSLWSKIFASLKPVPKIKPLQQQPAASSTKISTPELYEKPEIKSPIFVAPKLTTTTPKKMDEHIKDFVSTSKAKPQKNGGGPSFWEKLASLFKGKPRVSKIKHVADEDKESILSETVKRNGYKVKTVQTEMHVPKPEIKVPNFQEFNKKLDELVKKDDFYEIKPKIAVAPPLEPPQVAPPSEPKIPEPSFAIPEIRRPASASAKVVPPPASTSPAKIELTSKYHQPVANGGNRLLAEAGGVDLIPTAAKVRSWRQISGLLLLAATSSILVVIALYGSLFVQQQTIIEKQKKQQQELAAIEKKILDFQDLNKNIQNLGKEITMVQDTLSKHIYWTKFFALLEKYTLPEVHYSGLSAGNSGALTLVASADSYETLARQLKLLQQETAKEFVAEVAISSATRSLQGINFNIVLTLNSDLFYYLKLQ